MADRGGTEVEATSDEQLPVQVVAEVGEPLLTYVRARLHQHTTDWYAGIPISKFPEDLRAYEHLIWRTVPEVIVEIGTHLGGSALWFRDRLATLASYRKVADPLVISIDVDSSGARDALGAVDPNFEHSILLVEGDVGDPAVAQTVGARVEGRRCLVVEDSAHVYETTWASLEHFCGLVPVGGFFVVEDGCVDDDRLRISEDWPRGVRPAVDDWLATERGRAFRVRRDLELYGVSCHPGGWLERIAPD